MHVSRLLPALLTGLLMALSGCEQSPPPDALREGALFPNLRLTGLTVPDIRLGDLRGRFVVLNVWATWCPACRRELPSLVRLQRGIATEHLTVLTLSVDDDAELAQEYLRQRDIDLPAYIDRGQDIAHRLLGIRVFPDTFIIGPDGRLLRRIVGEMDWDRPDVVARLRRAAVAGDEQAITGIAVDAG